MAPANVPDGEISAATSAAGAPASGWCRGRRSCRTDLSRQFSSPHSIEAECCQPFFASNRRQCNPNRILRAWMHLDKMRTSVRYANFIVCELNGSADRSRPGRLRIEDRRLRFRAALVTRMKEGRRRNGRRGICRSDFTLTRCSRVFEKWKDLNQNETQPEGRGGFCPAFATAAAEADSVARRASRAG
jgi:hypothetical protein